MHPLTQLLKIDLIFFQKHNKYLRARRLYVATQEAEEKCYQLVTKRLSEIEYEKTKNKPFPWW